MSLALDASSLQHPFGQVARVSKGRVGSHGCDPVPRVAARLWWACRRRKEPGHAPSRQRARRKEKWMSLRLFVGGLLILTACTSQPGPSREPGARQSTVAGASDGTSRLIIREIIDPRTGVYTEGSIAHVLLENAEGGKIVDRDYGEGSRNRPRFDGALPVGSYRLTSYQRPCDGSCDSLDPPTDRCSLGMQLNKGEIVTATIHLSPGQGCTITLDRDEDNRSMLEIQPSISSSR